MMANKLLYTWDKTNSIDTAALSTYSEALIFDGNKRTLWHKGRQFGNAYYMPNDAVGGETFNDFGTNTAMGAYSHAEGSHSVAYAFAAHSEGYNVNVDAVFSHGEGAGNTIKGAYNHVEGYNVNVDAVFSHGEGAGNTIKGAYNHVEGTNNTVNGYYNHVSGDQNTVLCYVGNITGSGNYVGEGASSSVVTGQMNQIYGPLSHVDGLGIYIGSNAFGSHGEGVGNVAYSSITHVEGQDNVAYETAITSHVEGVSNRTYSDGSHVEGYGNRISTNASYSHAEGCLTLINDRASYAHTEGYKGMIWGIGGHVEGIANITYGNGGHAEGFTTVSSSSYSHAEGVGTRAYEFGSHAEGGYNWSRAPYSHTEGAYNWVETTATAAHAEGISTAAYAIGSHTEGYLTKTDNNAAYAHVEGVNTIAYAIAGHAEGTSTRVLESAQTSHVEGYDTATYGFASHAEGVKTVAYYKAAHSEGIATYAFQEGSHAEGKYTSAYGIASHVEGAYTYAGEAYSHAGGLLTYALGTASTTLGIGTVADEAGSLSIGSYNLAYGVQGRDIGSTLFAIGNGTSYTARHNLLGIHNGAYLDDGRYGNYRMIFNGDVDAYSVCASSYITAYNNITTKNDVVINDAVTLTTKQPVEYVDLGLPSGTLWAAQNAGGDTVRYFQWAETDGYVTDDIPQRTSFSWGDYKYCKGTNQTFTKYCNVSSYGYYEFTDSLTTLETIDDAASKSCIDGVAATVDQANELLSNTNAYLIKSDGTEIHGTLYGSAVVWDSTPDITELLSGVEFRSKTDAAVKIFVPASGGIYERDTNTIGHAGGFWLADLGGMPYSGKALYFDNEACTCTDLTRAYGCPFRAVKTTGSKDIYASLPLSGGVLATETSIDGLRSEMATVTMSSATGDYDEWETIINS